MEPAPDSIQPDPQALISLAVELAGAERSAEFIAGLADVDVDVARQVMAQPLVEREALLASPSAELLRGRLVERLLDRRTDTVALTEVESLLAAMVDPPAPLWARLGEAALKQMANRQAMEAFEQAVRIEEERPAMDAAQLFEHVLHAADAALHCGSSAVFDRYIRRALDLADRLNEPNALARVLALRTDPGFATDDVWLGYFDRAWAELASPRSVLAVELLRSQVYATYLSDQEHSTAMAVKAKELAGELDTPSAWHAALDAMRLAAVRSNSPAELADIGNKLVAVGRSGDLDALAKGYEASIFAGLLHGEMEVVERHVAAYAAHASRTRHPRHRVMVSGVLTLLAIARGDLEAARSRSAEALGEALSVGDSLGIQVALAQQAMVAIETGDTSLDLPIDGDQMDANPLVRWWRLGQLLRACRTGRRSQAAELLSVLLPDDDAIDQWYFVWLGELVVLTDAAVLVGDHRLAAALADVLRPHSDRFATLGTTVALGSVWRPIAGVSALLGDVELADRQYRQAEEANRRTGALLWLGRGRIEHARLLHGVGQQAEATALIETVVDTCERLDLPCLNAEANALQEETGLNRPSLKVPGLTDRETELLTAVAAGRSNRELAEQFYVSIKTVERHLSSIYTKLAVTGRDEAVQAAFGETE